MRPEMCRINHQTLRTASLFCQGDKDPVKDTQAAPQDEAIIQSPVRTICFRGAFPLKAVADHVNDPVQNTTVIHTGNPMRQRKKTARLDPPDAQTAKTRHSQAQPPSVSP
mgnify:CR=1 FL=1